ncbi:ABC transporter substrate-binding protein [Fundicoccus culcitae]|uniref:ABC transporter substrate-binding protein n=1 Tax=Fundicoccus culcitae TaxID=2969821 RepID=A0ABY5P8P9_9LACT|nr:ABC transporter substrate-binding protein [Fundicoccus culcitae]UUX35121.1 ABC transporter substrate-binding protein [Fundicoccus culcitae]
MIKNSWLKLINILVILVTVSGAFLGLGFESVVVAQEEIQVDFWSAPQAVQYDLWTARANAFNETNTEIDGKVIRVKVQQMPETPSSEAGIQNALATGTAPAVSENINRGFASILANSGVVYDISNEDWFNEVIEARQMEEAMENWAIDGSHYVLPVYVNPMAWQWNVKGLEALGFDSAPTTVEEFQNVMTAFGENREALSDIGITHSFYRPSLSRPDQYWDRWFDFQMIYNGLSQAKPIIEENQLVMDRQDAIDALQLIGMFGNSVQLGELASVWVEDTPSVLVTINAPWEINLYEEYGKVYGEDYVYGPAIVRAEGDLPYNYADSKGLTFYKSSNISEEQHLGAVEFVKWVFNAENSAQSDLEWLEATAMLPVRGDLNDNEVFSDMLAQYPALSALAEWVPYSIPGLATANDPDIWTAFTEVATAPYLNEMSNYEPGDAPDASTYIDAAIEAMRQAGELE